MDVSGRRSGARGHACWREWRFGTRKYAFRVDQGQLVAHELYATPSFERRSGLMVSYARVLEVAIGPAGVD